MAEITITSQNFEQEVLLSPIPVLVDFWATWCGPCRMIAPALEEIALEQEGIIKVGKVNADEEMELATSFGITSIPTLLVFKNGQLVNQADAFSLRNGVADALVDQVHQPLGAALHHADDADVAAPAAPGLDDVAMVG